MKKLILPLITLLLFSFSTDTSKLSDEDRKKAVDHLENTRDEMSKILKGLSEAQLNFKAEEDSWSIAECAEHLAISENAFAGLIQKTLASGPNPALKDSVKFKDDQLLGLISDRSKKVKTREPFEPTGKFGSHEGTVKAFMDKREEHINYMKTTEDDLRNHFNSDLPFGTVDGVQVILFISGHTERHLNQMKEVMEHKLFPKG